MKPLRLMSVFVALLMVMLPVCFADQISLVYDANGNLVTGDGNFREYNSLNQLSKIYNGSDSNGLLLEELTYHPTEERILVKKVYNNDTSLKETVYYVDENFVRIVNSSGSYDFIYVKHEGQLVAQEMGGTKYYIHGDAIGSTKVVTDADGNAVENSTTSPFGEIIDGGEIIDRVYEGKEFDNVVGDYDFHFRKYKPSWSIFLQPDTRLNGTITEEIYNPQNLNKYAFERNNPYRYTDPTGHFLLPIIPTGKKKLKENEAPEETIEITDVNKFIQEQAASLSKAEKTLPAPVRIVSTIYSFLSFRIPLPGPVSPIVFTSSQSYSSYKATSKAINTAKRMATSGRYKTAGEVIRAWRKTSTYKKAYSK